MVGRSTWTEDEDNALRSAVERHGTNWACIVETYNQNTPGRPRERKQCRTRWCDHLDPALIHGPFTDTERQRLFFLHQEYGSCWMAIAQQLPNRSSNCIKNEFYSCLKRGLRNYNRRVPPSRRKCRQAKSMVSDKNITLVLGMTGWPEPVVARRLLKSSLPSIPSHLF